MSAWFVASIIGGVFAVVIIILLVVVSRAVMRTAQNASELMVALEQVQAQTSVLADLRDHTDHAERLAGEAASVLEDLRQRNPAGDDEGNGHAGH